MSRRTPILYRFAESFFRHRWIFLFAVLIVSGITTAALLIRGQTYTASALTQVVTQDVAQALGDQSNNSWVTPAQQQVNHFGDLVNDNKPGGFLDTALTRANLAHPISVNPEDADPRYDALRKHLTAAPMSDSLFAISLVWNDRDECGKIVSALQQQYIEEVGLDRSAQSTATGRFLDSQIQDYANRMRAAESVLIKYRQSNTGGDPEIESAGVSQLASLIAQRDQAKITAQDASSKKVMLQQELNTMSPTSLLESTIGGNPYRAHLEQLQAELAALQLRHTNLAPDVIAKRQEIADYVRNLSTKLSATNVLNKVTENPEYRSVQQEIAEAGIAAEEQAQQLKNLDAQIAVYQQQVRQMPAAQKELTDRTRNYAVLSTEYNKLVSKREDIRLQGNLDKVSASSTLRPINDVASDPTLTRTKKIILIAGSLLLGIAVGLVILILSEWLNTSLRYEADTEFLLGVPVLTSLPEVSELKRLEDERRRNTRLLPSP